MHSKSLLLLALGLVLTMLSPAVSAQGTGSVIIQLSPTVGQNIGLIDPPWEDGTPPYNPALLPFGNYVGVQKHNSVFARSYLRFPLDAIPATATVTSARVEVYVSGWPFTGTATLGAYRVTVAWTEAMTWATRAGSDAAPVSTAVVSSTAGWYSWDVTALVQGWRAGQPNHGAMLAAVPPADSGVVTPPGWAAEVPGRLSPDAAHAPRLIVNYVLPSPTPTTLPPTQPPQPPPPEKPPKDTPVPTAVPITNTPVPTPAILPETGRASPATWPLLVVGCLVIGLVVKALEAYVEARTADQERLPLRELGALLAPAAEGAELTEEELLHHARQVRCRIWQERYEKTIQAHSEQQETR